MKDTVSEAAKITPPTAAVLTNAQDWVVFLTLIYTILLIFDKFYPGVLAGIGQCLWARIKGVFRGKGK